MKSVWMVVLLIAGCASSSGLMGETVGEQFRRALANVDAFCKKNKMGPYLDRDDPESWRRAAVTDCEVLKIKPFDLNAVLATPEGKFAYSIQLPPPLDKPRVKRSDYRSAEEYFKGLCERENIETTLKKPTNVDGVAFLREPSTSWRRSLSSYSEESSIGTIPPDPEELLLRPNSSLKFVERMVRSEERKLYPTAKYLHFERNALIANQLRVRPVDQLSATYGYVFRGTEAFNDRESGIWGGEAILVEIGTGNVAGIWRAFGRDTVDTNYIDQVRHFGYPCPGAGGRDYTYFLLNLLQSKEQK
jgi:hypothetical protein